MRAEGHEVVSEPSLNDEALRGVIASEKPHVLVVRSTKVSVEMMDANPGLELIVRAGAGYDTIDVDGASRRGIFVANCPGKNAVAVAELAFEHYKKAGSKPNLGLMMGGDYYGLPRYVILASLGIDPGLPEQGALNDGIYGSLYYANPASIGDRIGGPIILTRGTSQIDRLWNDDNILGF